MFLKLKSFQEILCPLISCLLLDKRCSQTGILWGVFNLSLVGCLWPRVAMTVVQPRVTNVLKTPGDAIVCFVTQLHGS